MAFMKIGEIAKKTKLTVDTIRFYEKKGLIARVARGESDYREFDLDSASTLEFIAHCRTLDISIPEIKKLLHVRSGSAKSCREANLVIDRQIDNLRQRIAELKRLEKNLAQLRTVCNQELAPSDCAIIKSLQKN